MLFELSWNSTITKMMNSDCQIKFTDTDRQLLTSYGLPESAVNTIEEFTNSWAADFGWTQTNKPTRAKEWKTIKKLRDGISDVCKQLEQLHPSTEQKPQLFDWEYAEAKERVLKDLKIIKDFLY